MDDRLANAVRMVVYLRQNGNYSLAQEVIEGYKWQKLSKSSQTYINSCEIMKSKGEKKRLSGMPLPKRTNEEPNGAG